MPRKALMQHQAHTEIDENGKMKRVITDEFKGYVDTEPDYIKIYIGTQLCLNNLDPTLAPYIVAFGPHMTYANDPKYQHIVRTDSIVKEDVALQLNVSVKRVDQIIKKLVDAGIFIPMYRQIETNGVITQKKRNGVYFVNPWVVARGKWQDIKKLQQEIDFVKGTSSYVISDDEGTRKITCSLPTNSEAYHQMSLEDYTNE